MNIREFSQNLLKIYQEMSESFSHFQSSAGWNCMSGCGRCCQRPEIDASPLEMLPMALQIYDEGKLEEWLERLENLSDNRCPLFVPGPQEGQGKCGRYKERPGVCRMFGVAGYLNKNQEVTLSICKYIREEYKIESIPVGLDEEKTPITSHWSYRLATLDQGLIKDLMPIPQALKIALEKIAFYAQYQSL